MNAQAQGRNDGEEKKTITLDRYGAQDIIDAIEALAMTAICLKNDMPGCEKHKSVRMVLGRNFVKFYNPGRKTLITLVGSGVLLVIRSRTFKLVVYGDDNYFRLFKADKLVARGKRLTWNGAEEIYTAQEFMRFVRRTVRLILDVCWI
jgi:hypothetical protein